MEVVGKVRSAHVHKAGVYTPRVEELNGGQRVAHSRLGLPPDADGNGNYAFFDAANYALIQMTGGVTAISAV